MYTVTKYPHGTFSWVDNNSTDAAAAAAFYMALFGWGKIDIPIDENTNYTMFQHQGQHAAGFAPMQPAMREMGIPSHWSNYVTVDDVDALVDVVRANGGQILYGPDDVFDSGRMMQIQDPTGAALGLWQPRNHIGAGIVNTIGAMCWNELITNDAAAAKTFYSALFGWEFYGDEHYIHISNGGRNNGGMIEMAEMLAQTGMPPTWQVYFAVENVDAALARVTELGGGITMPKQEAPGTGWFALVTDPAGVHFYLMELLHIDPWLEHQPAK